MIKAFVEGCLDKAVVESLVNRIGISVDVEIAGGSYAPLEQAVGESKGLGKCFLIAIDSDSRKVDKISRLEKLMEENGMEIIRSNVNVSDVLSYYVAKVNKKYVAFVVMFWEPELEDVLWKSLEEIGCKGPKLPECCDERRRQKLYRKLECVTTILCLAREGTLVADGNKCGFNVRRALNKADLFRTETLKRYVEGLRKTLNELKEFCN